jgi:hypothetical protein
MNKEIRNAKITSTMLGFEDHGILTCMLHLDYGSLHQGFGGYSLKYYGIEFIEKVLRAVGVETWEELRGKHVRVESDNLKVYRIGHIIEDRWYEPEGR